jgi:uncharacterized protein YcgL (UPF0745 family)
VICSIYKSAKKEGAYLYIPHKDKFDQVPEALMQMFGKPYFVMVIKLEGRRLAQVDIEKVTQSLQTDGYFLQLPPPTVDLLKEHKARKAEGKS